MKNQYFGDVNDYRKYGLLRALIGSGDLSLAVAWMLTPDDGGTDGGFRRYLAEPSKWRQYDPQLFDYLATSLQSATPSVSIIEQSGLLPGATYFSDVVPDGRHARSEWAERLLHECKGADLVFLDPDNGFEVKSKPVGRKDSSKYVTWGEVEAVWASGSSVLIYQHFCREPRASFTRRLVDDLMRRTGASFVEAFATPHVLFLLAVQDAHEIVLDLTTNRLSAWHPQIRTVGLEHALASQQEVS